MAAFLGSFGAGGGSLGVETSETDPDRLALIGSYEYTTEATCFVRIYLSREQVESLAFVLFQWAETTTPDD